MLSDCCYQRALRLHQRQQGEQHCRSGVNSGSEEGLLAVVASDHLGRLQAELTALMQQQQQQLQKLVEQQNQLEHDNKTGTGTGTDTDTIFTTHSIPAPATCVPEPGSKTPVKAVGVNTVAAILHAVGKKLKQNSDSDFGTRAERMHANGGSII